MHKSVYLSDKTKQEMAFTASDIHHLYSMRRHVKQTKRHSSLQKTKQTEQKQN